MKKPITIVLLLFVAASIVFLGIKEFSSKPVATTGNDVEGSKVIAYYFHATQRCPTCLKIEKYAHTAVDSFFTERIKEGKLEFRSLNTDEPAYDHFTKDYQLVSQSLVLVRYKDGVQQKWENMGEVWTLVGDQDQFFAYVKDGVERHLKELD